MEMADFGNSVLKIRVDWRPFAVVAQMDRRPWSWCSWINIGVEWRALTPLLSGRVVFFRGANLLTKKIALSRSDLRPGNDENWL